MTLASRLADLVSAVGADIKSLRTRLAAVEGGTGSTGSTICVINAATRLIQTQKITMQMASRGQAL